MNTLVFSLFASLLLRPLPIAQPEQIVFLETGSGVGHSFPNYRAFRDNVTAFSGLASPTAHPFDLYDNRQDLGNQGPPDGATFRGRGFVRLTGRFNYTKYSSEINKDLVGDPELANDAAIAAQLPATFLKDKEDRIRETLAINDLASARRWLTAGFTV